MRNRKLLGKRIAATVMVAALTVSLCACGENNKTTDNDKKDTDTTNNEITATGEGYGKKDETVYVMTNGAGEPTSVKVVSWLKNFDDVRSLKDITSLENITNIKGNETFNVSNGEVVFDTNGNDIYYEGTIDASKLPVNMKITYKLDGADISQEDLVGKTGHVTMSVKFTSVEKRTVKVNDKEYEVYVPFTALSAAMLDQDTFSNITVDNGKIISNGNYQVVCGFGLAGINENLESEELKDLALDGYTVEADVKNFETPYMMTYVGNQLLNGIDVSEINDVSDIFDKVNLLTDSSNALLNGTNTLAEGVAKIVEQVAPLKDSVNKLNEYTISFKNNADYISGKTNELSAGIAKIQVGTATLNSKVNELVTGTKDFKAGTATLYSGLQLMQKKLAAVQTDLVNARAYYKNIVTQSKATIDYLNNAATQAGSLTLSKAQLDSIEGYYQAVGAVAALDTVIAKFTAKDATTNMTITESVTALVNGGKSVDAGAQTIYQSAVKLYNEGTSVLLQGVNSANEGAGALASGLSEYAQKMGEYQTGVATLNSKVPQLIDGLNQLNEGVEKLNDGMKQFVEEGINKIAELASADVEAEFDKVKAVIAAASEYTAIDGDNENSAVKFIIKTN